MREKDHCFVVLSTAHDITYGPFRTEEDAIAWAKFWQPEGGYRVLRFYPHD